MQQFNKELKQKREKLQKIKDNVTVDRLKDLNLTIKVIDQLLTKYPNQKTNYPDIFLEEYEFLKKYKFLWEICTTISEFTSDEMRSYCWYEHNLKNKEFFISKKSNLDFQNPKTDLEKLALYYLQGTNHPGLKKPDNNEILNAAVHMDIPHFETILANCRDLEQAKACVARYVRRAKGLYSLYYLACQINSIRQEIESEELKNGKFLRPGQRHAEQL